jgi:Replication-relaxation
MARQTLKKFIGGKKRTDLLRIESRDIALLQDLASYRFLNTEQIAALHNRGTRNLQRRLHDLYHSGYIDRPPQQNIAGLVNRHIVYGLGIKGAEVLFADAEERDEKVRLVKQNRRTTFPYIAHALMISQFRATLTLALRSYPSNPKIEKWLQGYELKDALALRGENPELVPDAFFTIGEGNDALDFFLEADRSTMPRERVLDKLKIYWKWYKEGRQEKTLGIRNFRVLTITKSEERAENLRKIAKNADDKKTGSNMFLFLSETQYDLTKPEAMLSPIWASAKNEKHAILE